MLDDCNKDKLVEKCAVVGVYGKGMEAARIVHAGLWALQHRGQESSGIATSNGNTIKIHKGTGLVAHVYDENILASLNGFIAIGHNRYSTSGGTSSKHNQPVFLSEKLALAHNGNLPSVVKLEKFLAEKNITTEGLNDSGLMYEAITYYLKEGMPITDAIKKSMPLFTGVYSLVVMTPDSLVALRDPYGIRPLSVGKINGGFIFASETCALNTVNATYLRDIQPGEMVVCNTDGMKSYQVVKGKEQVDAFEFVYFARPDSMILGKSVNQVRKNLGRNLAKENNIEADVVIPVPDSGIPAALGFSEVSGIPFDHGFIKNRYIHRTFIRPAQKLRETDLTLKLNPLPEVIKDKKVIIIDDSIVRGTTSKKLVSLIRSVGAKEVHLFISSPPVKFPDFYGIDTPKQSDLIASHMKIPEIEKFIGADSVRYLSYDGLIDAIGVEEDHLCTSCFTGRYPVDIAERKEELDFTV